MDSSKPFPRGRIAGAATAALLALLGSAGAASAQGVQSEQLPAVQGAPQGKAQKGAAAGGGGGGDASLRQRVEQLEAQLVDLQVVIGTLESLARTGGVSSAPVRSEASGGVAASDRARLDSMETQIRALTAQVEQLAAEVRAQGGVQRRSDAQGLDTETSRFGSTTVTSDNADPIGALAGSAEGYDAPAQPRSAPPAGGYTGAPPDAYSGGAAPPPTYGSESLPPAADGQFAAVEPGAGTSPKQLYETAYGRLLQQDYGAAQAGFRDFLKSYPQDPLAPNALYWLGESHYVQRNYADAAEAFDLVVSTYGTSSKAPDAQLKRGMSLAQLGKRQDACSVLRGISSKFPNAPVQLKAKADSERQRIGCP
jgi:tol-pal system protein YbgF